MAVECGRLQPRIESWSVAAIHKQTGERRGGRGPGLKVGVLSADKASNPSADFRGSGSRYPRSAEHIRLNDRGLLNAN